MKIGIIILAAGGSSRLGRPKQLIQLDDEFLINKIVRVAEHSKADACCIVLGAYQKEIQEKLKKQWTAVLINSNWKSGMAGSLKQGIAHFESWVDAVLVLLVDQPGITTDYLNELIESASEQKIIASDYGNFAGVPAIFPSTVFPELLKLKEDRGARQILAKGSFPIKRIKPAFQLLDLDTEAAVLAWNNSQEENDL